MSEDRYLAYTVGESTALKRAMRKIDKNGHGIVVVRDAKKAVVGLLTDGDVRRAVLEGIELSAKVKDMMTKDPIVFLDGWDVHKMHKYLAEKKVREKGAFDRLIVPVVNKKNQLIDIQLVERGRIIPLLSEEANGRGPVKKVLVIGGAGYIGSVLVRLLLSQGIKVTVLDSILYNQTSLDEVKEMKGFLLIIGDVRHIEDVSRAMEGVDAVVHLAEVVGDPAAALNPKVTQEVNYLATRLVASTAKHFHINRLVYVSSCSVYGYSENDEVLTEESSLNPVSLYSRMKLTAEEALMQMSDNTFRPTILRLSTVHGFSPRPRFDLVVNLLTAKAVVEGEIPVFGGEQWRPHVHVSDVANTILSVLQASLDKVGGQVMNVGHEEDTMKMFDLAERVHAVVPKAKVSFYLGKQDHRSYRVGFEKLKTVLGEVILKRVGDGIEEVKQALLEGKVSDYNSSDYANATYLQSKLFGGV